MTSLRFALILALVTIGAHSAAAQGSTKPPPAARPRPAARPATPLPRGYILLGANYALSNNDFEDTANERSNAENGSIALAYEVSGGPVFEGAGAFRVWRSYGFRAAVGRSSTSAEATLDASIPHPFFFDRPRTATATIDELDRSETAIGLHLLAMFPITRRMQLAVFAGPTWMQLSQETVRELSFSETYPYDTVAFSSAATAKSVDTKVTVGGGADLNYFFNKSVGLGATVQFAQADADVSVSNGRVKTITAGGVKAGLSVSLRIP